MNNSDNTITCLVIDDEAPARKVILNYLSNLENIQVAAECKNAFEAIEAINKYHPDLIFLDINMPKLSGLDFLKTLSDPPLVIITTAYREYAIEGYELNVLDYLHKPFPLNRFLLSMQKARTQIELRSSKHKDTAPGSPKFDDGYIFLKEDKKLVRLDLKNILYIKSLGDYLQVVTKGKPIVSYMSLKKMETLLDSNQFPRIHKSYIVNTAHVISVESNIVRVADKRIPLGARYKNSFTKLVNSPPKKDFK